MKLVLASSSPRRAHLLDQLGLDYEASPADVDETPLPDEVPAAYVERLAMSKALAVGAPGLVTVGADTAISHGGHTLGKPGHPHEARSMLRRLQGSTHEVYTGVAVCRDGEMPVSTEVAMARVTMMAMTEEEISGYVATGEPMDKAGSYAIQGRGGIFVESVEGSPFTVIGLPLHLLPRLLARVGCRLADFEADADPSPV